MQRTAAVLFEANRLLRIDTVRLADPKPREVRARVVASSVWGSDLGKLPIDPS